MPAQPEVSASTAIFITEDEGGGYYDSGYIQPVDFFGDGTRIPLPIVSPFSEGGHLSYNTRTASPLLNSSRGISGLKPLTARSRDNLPNPKTAKKNSCVPLNTPTIDDLFSAFKF